MSSKKIAAREPGFRPILANRMHLMLAFTILLAVAAALVMLFVGHAQPNLYQGF